MTDRWPDKHAYNRWTQWGEDGILEAVFEKIGVKRKFCVDVGAADGLLFSNVRQFLEQGWQGVLIESDPERFATLTGQFPDRGYVTCCNEKVETHGLHSLDNILDQASAPEEFDLLSIDIDGQDYYIWNSLLRYRPRVVVIEYEPDVDPMFIPPLGGPGQAGWNATTYVAAARGYLCICRTKTNLICVRKDILEAIPGLTMTIGHSSKEGPQLEPVQTEESKQEPANKPVKITAVISVPRLGFNTTWASIIRSMLALQIHVEMVEGVFWGQCLTRGIEKAIAGGAEIILTIDYDSIFDVQHVIKMCQLLADTEDFDVLVPVQIKRECDELLFSSKGVADISREIIPIKAGHFGLTVFDSAIFSRLPKPWFWGQPNKHGDWGDGRVDDDMWFWKQCEKAGINVGLAQNVRLGHLELGITWPDPNFKPIRQSVSDYRANGQPKECGGGLKVELLAEPKRTEYPCKYDRLDVGEPAMWHPNLATAEACCYAPV